MTHNIHTKRQRRGVKKRSNAMEEVERGSWQTECNIRGLRLTTSGRGHLRCGRSRNSSKTQTQHEDMRPCQRLKTPPAQKPTSPVECPLVGFALEAQSVVRCSRACRCFIPPSFCACTFDYLRRCYVQRWWRESSLGQRRLTRSQRGTPALLCSPSSSA